MTFQPNVPQSADLLSNSQGDLLVNFQQLNTKFGVDHVPFSPAVTNSGKHNKVTLPQQGSDPATAALEGAIYTKDISGSTTLVYRAPSNGTITQLIPASTWDLGNTRGTLLLGAVRMNYGYVTVSSGGGQGSATATFATAFSDVPYSVTVTPTSQGGVAADSFWVNTPTASSIKINQQGVNAISARVFYYTAIGPA